MNLTKSSLITWVVLQFCLGTLPANAGTASYLFDGNLSDGSSDFDAVGTSEPMTFLQENGRNYLSLGREEFVTLPVGLTTATFAETSFEISFDFRIKDTNEDQILFGAGFGMWGGGFNVVSAGPRLVFVYSDEEVFVWNEIKTDLLAEQWYTVRLSFNIELGYWQVIVDDEIKAEFTTLNMDQSLFQEFLGEIQFTLGGINNEHSYPYVEAVDIDNLIIDYPATANITDMNNAFRAMTDDLNDVVSLSEEDKSQYLQTVLQSLYFAEFSALSGQLLEYTETYEALNPPLYHDGGSHRFEELPSHDQLLQYSQGYLFLTQFVAGNLNNVEGIVFEHAEILPGLVHPATPRIGSATVEVHGSYNSNIAAPLSAEELVVRPTGYYLAPGEIVTITVPATVIDQGLSVIVGAHFRNMDYTSIGYLNRFPDVSAEYPLNATEIQLANPFGGGIYLKVPEGTSAGYFEMTIQNAIQSPYFSWRDGRKTEIAEWLTQVAASGAPWSDFESDKFMFTLPTSELAGVTNPDEIMARWDEIMDEVQRVGGKPLTRSRADYYSFDTRLVTPAYGAGYPLVIPIWEAFNPNEEGWNPLKVLDELPHNTLLHEMGHNQHHPSLGYGGDLNQCHKFEAETVNHMLAVSIYSNVYGLSIEEAFANSSTWAGLTFDEAAFDWLITSNFRNNLRMYEEATAPIDDKNQLHYQARSWAKYGDIARLFGWSGLSNTNGMFYQSGMEQSSSVCAERPFIVGRDEYIRAASEAIGVNMTPLFHFWGINPSDELVLEMKSYPQSQEIYELIQHYRNDIAPTSFADYQAFHDQIYDKVGYQQPRYDQYLSQFDDAFAADIEAQFTFLFDTYFPSGAPADLTGDGWPSVYNGISPQSNLNIGFNNIGRFDGAEQIIYSCLRIFTNGIQSSIDGVEKYDVSFELVSVELGIIRVDKARRFNVYNSLNENSELPDCSGVFETTTGVYTDIIQAGNQTMNTVFELSNPDTLEMRLVSFDEIVAAP